MNNTQTVEALSPDVVALCALLARIMHRCLVERDARILALLSVPDTEVEPCATVQQSEVSHEHAA